MYTPSAFIENDPEELQAIMQATSLPVLISPGNTGLLATHMPLLFEAPDRLIGHVARANPHWREFDPAAESLAIFTATDGYISPSFYPTKAETGKVVPTWNYQAVHAAGRLEITEDPAALLAIVTRLTNHHESSRTKPWAVADAPAGFIASQLNGIVGITLHITRLEGKAKLSQNRLKQDQIGATEGVARENPALAAAMRKANGL